MREILFRGLIQDEKGFVYGKLVYNNVIRSTKKVFDRFEYLHDVTSDIKIDPETVGQYTGLKDKNGVKIFEGDRVVCKHTEYEVYFYRGSFRIGAFTLLDDKRKLEIIGNIHEGDK